MEWMGWLATVLFAGSYFCKDPIRLRLLQAVAAVVWIAYGLAIGAVPVVVANAIVASLALYSARGAAASGAATGALSARKPAG